ncbi:avidin/streptavidin family protein [Rhizobium sp. AG855]|uniref:avidin/streptavidin family protein n=1 Tax=Rhizobium sp. AG855 TaxID=2183898 RepID=UPI000FF75D03|nr:avidin/streptavidin family protein [Rhizobium sp. AG855]RKE84106.1 avidin family protein [Rhizobium sp. AG855]
MRVAAFLLATCLWPTVPHAAPAGETKPVLPAFSGTTTWVNRHGSIMVLDLGQDGELRGYFVNNAPGKGCRGIPYDLSGHMFGEAVDFHVRWRNGVADCLTETEWHGHMQPSRNGGLEIVAKWQRRSTLAPIGARKPMPQTGSDLFTLQVTTGLQSQIEID